MNLLDELPAHRSFFDRYPDLRPPLLAGDFQPSTFLPCCSGVYGKPIEIACYHVPCSRSAMRFYVRTCDTGDELRWHAWGDWCEYGRTSHDACYDFLDGGGSFATRKTAEWAIHLYVARLLAEDVNKAA